MLHHAALFELSYSQPGCMFKLSFSQGRSFYNLHLFLVDAIVIKIITTYTIKTIWGFQHRREGGVLWEWGG